MPQVLNTLYVTHEEAYVRLENNTLCVEIDREKRLQVPLHHISAVVCFGGASVSLPAMHRLADEAISLVLLDRNGRFRARLEGATGGNILLRKAQFAKAEDGAFCHHIASAMLVGKLRNTRHLVVRALRDHRDVSEQDKRTLQELSSVLVRSVRTIEQHTTLDALRGMEGSAASQWFSAISLLIKTPEKDAFIMNGRTRRPPLDRFNALLSFLYALITNDCRSAVETAGLDPQLGFLHAVRPGRAALALDIMEEFRALWADRLALTLINRGQIKAADFVISEGGAVLLKDDARRTVLTAYQERKKEEILHPLTNQKMPLGIVPLVQARILARVIRGELEHYVPFLAR